MQLEYLWIKSFRGFINEQGFNFSREFDYKYNPETKVLTRTQKKDTLPESFFHEKISNITALVGQNGAGKSSVLDFIKQRICGFTAGGASVVPNEPFFIIFGNHIFHSEMEFYEVIGIEGYKVEDRTTEGALKTIFGDIKFLYFSNVFDYQVDSSVASNLISISTNHLLVTDSKTSDGKFVIYNFISKEIERQITFISEMKYIPKFKIPEELSVGIKQDVELEQQRIEDKMLAPNILKHVKEAPDSDIPLFKVKKQIFYNFIKLLSSRNKIDFGILGEDIWSFFINQYDSKYLAKITYPQSKAKIELIGKFFKIFDSLVEQKKIESIQYNDLSFKYFIDKNDNSIFFDLMRIYRELAESETFFELEWRNLSSGEKALLSFFSRFYYAKKSIDFSYVKNNFKELIILIDEPDLYLHPKWQKEQVRNIINILPEIFNNMKRLQIIITTNSPFILSDIPKSNVVFLKKENDQLKQANLEREENTFGANIHTLLSDAFFMEDGLIGAFAKKKIEEIIDDINNAKAEKKAEVRKVIALIGDNLIKARLTDMYEEVFGESNAFENDEEYMDWLQKEMERIKLKNEE